MGDDYIYGTDVLVGSADLTDEQKFQAEHAMAAVKIMMLGGTIGFVVGGVGGAWLWASHRVAGFLIGSFLVGGPVGSGIGIGVAAKHFQEMDESMRREKISSGRSIPTGALPVL